MLKTLKSLMPALAAILLLATPAAAQKKGSQPVVPTRPAQTDSLKKYELYLQMIADSMVNGHSQTMRIRALTDFIPLMVHTLKFHGSFDYPFDSLQFMKILTPPDRSFRLYNWTVAFKNGTFRYYGAIQFPSEDSLRLVPLRDFRTKIDTAKWDILSLGKDDWLGALYYDLIQVEDKKKDTYYLLLGWDGADSMSNRRVIESLYFEEKGKPRFGKDVFVMTDGSMNKRIHFIMRDEATMTLKHIPEHNIIVFDHLVPPNPSAEGFRFTYIPDGTYDYLELIKGKWHWREDLFENFRKPIREAGDPARDMKDKKYHTPPVEE